MLGFGVLLFVVGLCALGWGAFQKMKARKIVNAPFLPTGQARDAAKSGKGSKLSAQGTVSCATTLRSPMKGAECLYWEYTVTAKWKESVWNEAQKKHEEKSQSKEVEKQRSAADFSIDDGSGPVRVDASNGGSFELEKSFDESTSTGRFGEHVVQTATLPVGATLSGVERILKPGQRLFVVGTVTEDARIGGPSMLARVPGLGAGLLISTKPRDELLGGAMRSAKRNLIGGAAATVIGLVLIVAAPPSKPDAGSESGEPAAPEGAAGVGD